MTRSIFDPTGGETERSGSPFTAPDADQISHLPEEFINPEPTSPAAIVDFQPPPDQPAVAVSSEQDGKLLVVRLSGKLHKEDYQRFVPAVEEAVRRHGKVRLLVEMHDFHGWDAGGLWEDVKFDVRHFNDIERLAIVGDSKWEKWMAAFCKPFTSATIKYFPIENESDARRWIAAP